MLNRIFSWNVLQIGTFAVMLLPHTTMLAAGALFFYCIGTINDNGIVILSFFALNAVICIGLALWTDMIKERYCLASAIIQLFLAFVQFLAVFWEFDTIGFASSPNRMIFVSLFIGIVTVPLYLLVFVLQCGFAIVPYITDPVHPKPPIPNQDNP